MSVYKGMFEACAITVNDKGEPVTPYFNMEKMKNYIDNYFKVNLKKYTNNYKVTYSYIGGVGTFICRSNCKTIQINLNAKINLFFDYNNSEIFTIKDGDNLWTKDY